MANIITAQSFIIGTIIFLILGIIALHVYNSVTSGSIITAQPIVSLLIISGIPFGLYFVFKSIASSATGLNLNSLLIPLAVVVLLVWLLIKQPNLIPTFSIAARKAVGLPLLLPLAKAGLLERR